MTSNPYESPDTPESSIEHPQGAPNFRIFGYVIGAVVILGLLVAFMTPMMFRGSAHGAARRVHCMNNMRQISLALLNYESQHGSLPPTYTVDEDGNRLHSWRTLILPYLEEKALYDSIDLTKPWDHPDNAEARETDVYSFRCSSANLEEFETTYLVANGSEFCFNGSTPRTLDEITDGTSKTVLVLDMPTEHAVHWMSPYDADEESILAVNEDSDVGHSGIFIAVFCDGSTRSFSVEQTPEARRAMLTIAGGEDVGLDD